MEPREELAQASELTHSGLHGPGSLDIDPEVARDLGLIETLEALRASIERFEPDFIVEGVDNTIFASGKKTNVAAAQTDIARLVTPRPGIYSVKIAVGIGVDIAGAPPTLPVNDVANMELVRGNRTLLSPIPYAQDVHDLVIPRVRLDGQTDLFIRNIAGSAGGINLAYLAAIIATRVALLDPS
jgi:hypothetical protein